MTPQSSTAAQPAPGYSVTRRDVEFPSGDASCAAWLYLPEGVEEPPLVVMAHGLGGTRHMRLDDYARYFAAQGMAALLFDYRGFGDSSGLPRQVVSVRAQLEDWRAALAYARAELPVDRSRIAIWGTSFGGGHVLTLAGEDPELAAVVAQCPFNDGLASLWRRLLAFPPSALLLTVLGLIDLVGSRLGRRPLLVPMAGSWWMPAYLAARDSLPGAATQMAPGTRIVGRAVPWAGRLRGVRRALGDQIILDGDAPAPALDTVWGVVVTPDGGTMTNGIAARLAVTLGQYRPVRALRRSGTTPILVAACDLDSVAPPGPLVRAARRHANVTVERYPYGHFEIYVGEGFTRAVADQAAFLRTHLGAR